MPRTILVVASGQLEAGLMGSYVRAFRSLGFTVEQLDLEAHRLAAVRGPTPIARAVHRAMGYVDVPSINQRANRRIVMRAMELRPEMVLVSCNEPVRPATLAQLRVALPGTKLAAIFPDTLFNLRENVVAGLPLYDVFATHTEAGVDVLRRLGCRAPFYLPLGADPELHHPMALSPAERREYGCEVVYVGNWRTEHEALFNRLEGHDLAIWGSIQWHRASPSSWSRARYRGREANGAEYAKAHIAAQVALNPIDPLNYPGHNMRCFELPACRVFSLVSRTPEMLELFEEGRTVAFFEGEDELADKVRYYLGHPEERERIAAAAYRHVVEGGHTYLDRARTLLGQLGIAF